MKRVPEYAIAGSHRAFMEWRSADVASRGDVIFLHSAERAEQLAAWAPPGRLHRLDGWEWSPARRAAELLEA